MIADVLYCVCFTSVLLSLSLTTSSYVMQAAGTGNPLLTALVQYILNVALTLPAILYLDTVSTMSPVPQKTRPVYPRIAPLKANYIFGVSELALPNLAQERSLTLRCCSGADGHPYSSERLARWLAFSLSAPSKPFTANPIRTRTRTSMPFPGSRPPIPWSPVS